MSKIKEVEYKPSEVYNIIKSTIEANDKIHAAGGIPISISVIGERGIGKSTIQKELAQDLDRQFKKISLAQLTEPSELIGYYFKEFEVKKEKQSLWITENLLPEYEKQGYKYVGKVRTTPCPPNWIADLKDNAILCLDDYTRSNSLFNQAIMELVNSHEMVGWDLKSKGVTILLNENPDNGEYNVSSNDSAQTDRMAKIYMKWDPQDWASRAEKIGLDERLINFVLWMPELLEHKKQDGISASGNISPRMMDKFFSLVSTIDDFEKHLDQISMFGEITTGKYLASNLINFVNKRLDKLPEVKKLIKEYDVKTAKAQLTECCGDTEKDPTNWKSATAAILTTRLYNYVRHYHKEMSKDNIKQYLEILLHPSFSVDQKYLLVRNTVTVGNQFAAILGSDPRFLKYMLDK
jgi:MoxR-like ATPase